MVAVLMVAVADTPTIPAMMDILRIDQINHINAVATETTDVIIESLSTSKITAVKTRSIIWTEATAWSGTIPVPRVPIVAIVAMVDRDTEIMFPRMSKLMPTENGILIVLQQRQNMQRLNGLFANV